MLTKPTATILWAKERRGELQAQYDKLAEAMRGKLTLDDKEALSGQRNSICAELASLDLTIERLKA